MSTVTKVLPSPGDAQIPARGPDRLAGRGAAAEGRHVRPLIFHQGKVYAHLFHEMGRPAALVKPGSDPYEAPPFKPTRAPRNSGEAVLPRAERGKLTVFTPKGACTPNVGEPLYISTHGCEPSYAIVLPLEGCGTDMAPLAISSPAGTGAVPAFSWSPLETTSSRVGPGCRARRAARRVRRGSLSRSLVRDWAHVNGATSKVMVRWQLGGPSERLDALRRVPVRPGELQRLRRSPPRRVAGRGWADRAVGGPRRFALVAPALGGAPARRAIAGFVGATSTEATLVLRHVDGAFEGVWSETFDHDDERTPWGMDIDFESPCAP